MISIYWLTLISISQVVFPQTLIFQRAIMFMKAKNENNLNLIHVHCMNFTTFVKSFLFKCLNLIALSILPLVLLMSVFHILECLLCDLFWNYRCYLYKEEFQSSKYDKKVLKSIVYQNFFQQKTLDLIINLP